MAFPLVSAFINFLMKDQAAKVIMHLASVMTASNIRFFIKTSTIYKSIKGTKHKRIIKPTNLSK